MNRCDPVEMRKNLEAVDEFRKAGIDFVAIPVSEINPKIWLIEQGRRALENLLDQAER